MSQYTSRIHIEVSSPEIWSRFTDQDDANFGLAELAGTDQTSFIIDSPWSVKESKLKSLVENLAKFLGKDGLIIADTTNINVDSYNYCVFYLGGSVRAKELGLQETNNMFSETDIADIAGWLSYGEFSVSKKELAVLFHFGIVQIGNKFEDVSKDIQIPDHFYLRETSFENRGEAIEKIVVGEEVELIPAKTLYDPFRLEAMSRYGSIGYLPSEISDELTPLLLSRHLSYTATIVEVVPASRRNQNTNSSIVKIGIQACISAQEIPKTAQLQNQKALESKKASQKENVQKIGITVDEQTLEAAQKSYLDVYAAWKKECIAIKERRVKAIAERITSEKNNYEAEAKKQYDAETESLRLKKNALEKAMADAQATITSLGILAIHEKKRQRSIIEAASAEISSIEVDLKKAEEHYQNIIKNISDKIAEQEPSIVSEIEISMPLPQEPERPDF